MLGGGLNHELLARNKDTANLRLAFLLIYFSFLIAAFELLPLLTGNARTPLKFQDALHVMDIMRDTPFNERPPVMVILHNDLCQTEMEKLGLTVGWLDNWIRGLPSRKQLVVGTYDSIKQYEKWYTDGPKADLEAFLGGYHFKCPSILLLSRHFVHETAEDAQLLVWDSSNSIPWQAWVHLHVLGSFEQPIPLATFTEAELEARDIIETGSHVKIAAVPPQLPTFSKHGYKKVKMPSPLIMGLRRFQRQYAEQIVDESWGIGSQINFHQVKTTMISLDLDPISRNRLADMYVLPIIQKWSKEYDLELTAFYGIRNYYRGAELRMHIDRTETHVLSAILNIEQENMDKPWMLEVIDHNGSRIELSMEPGEMILYESVSLPHGRPKPLQGDVYTNAFCHYRPKGWKYVLQGHDTLIDEGVKVGGFKHLDKGRIGLLSYCPLDSNISYVEHTNGEYSVGSVVLRNYAREPIVVLTTTLDHRQLVYSLKFGEQLQVDAFDEQVFTVRYNKDHALLKVYQPMQKESGFLDHVTFVACRRRPLV